MEELRRRLKSLQILASEAMEISHCCNTSLNELINAIAVVSGNN